MLVEYGVPGTELYVVKDGTLELVHNEVPVDVITTGEVFGHPTLLDRPPAGVHDTRSRGLDAVLHPDWTSLSRSSVGWRGYDSSPGRFASA